MYLNVQRRYKINDTKVDIQIKLKNNLKLLQLKLLMYQLRMDEIMFQVINNLPVFKGFRYYYHLHQFKRRI